MKAGEVTEDKTFGWQEVDTSELAGGQRGIVVDSEQFRIMNIRLGNIQKLLEAILEQNRKGVKTKTELSIDLVSVPPLETP